MKQSAARLLALSLACSASLVTTPPAKSEEPEPVAAECPAPALAPQVREHPDRTSAPIYMDAESFEATQGGTGDAVGHVELTRADQYLATEALSYDPQTRVITLPKPLKYRDAQIYLEAQSATANLNEQSGQFNTVDYGIVGSTANGSAEQVRIVGGNRSFMDQVLFTTCPGDNPEWMLRAKRLELRYDEGMGVAHGAQLRLGKVPVLYVPWFTFPIDERRKSGFLYPSFGNTNDNGLEFGIPWYWNIAPNQDATFIPRYFTDRGFMLSGEYRLLTRRTKGKLNYDFMPNDRIDEDTRYHYLADFNAGINPRWHTDATLEHVSDNAYFQDFGGSLAVTSRPYLRSTAGLDGAGRYWIFSVLFDDFQVIDDSVRPGRLPYRRLPRAGFLLQAPLGRQGFMIDMDSELVYFDRDVGVVGARADLFPSLVWNMNRRWGFLRASAGYRYTAYDLDWRGAVGDTSPHRGTEILSLDTGMYFEKLREGGDSVTLEPRLFYLYVPYEEQDQLPDFDTGDFTFGFAELFHYNRFTGADRQTDANQVTLAVTTRSISASSGRETWNLSLGQIVYFETPRVSLPGEDPPDQNASPFLGELDWSPVAQLILRLGLQWNWETSQLDVGSVGFGYSRDDGNRVSFEYRFRRDRLDQVDVRYLWPINRNWKLFTMVNYSLEDSELLEAMAGAEFESCCWAVRFAARRYLKDNHGGTRDSFYVELHLKGLGSLGREPPPLFYDPAD